MGLPLRVLIVEDEPDDADLLARELERAGFDPQCRCVDSEPGFLAGLEAAPDVILADYNLPRFSALGALKVLRERGLETPLLVVTGSQRDEAVVECLKEGACDYLLKDRLARLGPAVTQALARREAREETRRLEDQLRHAQKLESIGRLAGGIAHDFNNLLTVIMGNTDLALARLQTEDPVRREVEGIRRAAGRAADLTRQMLAFSRKQLLQPRVLQLNDVVSDMSAMLQRLIGADIELRTCLATDLLHVKADPGQLEQVIANLAVNARDAMPDGGTLTIETAPAVLSEAYVRMHAAVTPGPYVMLALTDTGTGMSPETKARLFEPFYTTKPSGKGTGLGLAMVYGIVMQSGGHIWVYTEPGRGSTFKIYLPAHEGAADAKAATAPRAPTPPRSTETILVAEDEEAVRELICIILRRQGYTVLEASNGDEALALMATHGERVHLLLSDIIMPGLGGRSLLEQLRTQHPSLRVLFVSGYTENVVLNEGMLDSRTAFLEKPFSPSALLNRVRDVLDVHH